MKSDRSSERVAVVTGASRGIGAAIARRLGREGMRLVVNSYPDDAMVDAAEAVVKDIERDGGRGVVVAADISDEADVASLFDRCETEYGPAEVLVLNAAASALEPWWLISEGDWDRVAAVNLRGAFLCCRRAFGAGRAGQRGAIVTLSSVLAEAGAVNSLHYTTTKAGIVGFTRALARELAGEGVRVNCVMPGAILTEAEDELHADADLEVRRILANQAIKRRGRPEDVAGAVSFLVGPDSAFMTGQVLCVDGGWILR